MATLEQNALLSYKDDSGNRVLTYPITKAECVDGLGEEIGLHADRDDNPHNVSASQIPYSNESSGITSTTVQAAIDELAQKPSGPSFSVVDETLFIS